MKNSCNSLYHTSLTEESNLLGLLELCYNQMPVPLCCCFTYCSLFPIDWMFEPEKMTQLWISQGFVSTNHERKSIQDVGRMYFNELVSRSFFEPVTIDGYTSYYTMRPIVHNFAEIMSGKRFLRIDRYSEGKLDKIVGRRVIGHIDHLSITADKLSLLEHVKLDQLITLIILGPSKSDDTDVLNDAIGKLKIIRTLYLAGCVINDFPDTENGTQFDNLRYLNLSDTGICRLPFYFNKLYLLELLNLQGCSLKLKCLPKGTECLVNLQHIIGQSNLISTLSGIGKLIKLQELEEFQVGTQQGHEISQLSRLSMLGGSLSITNLENVRNKDEASSAKLSEKTRLNSLKLEWSPEGKTNSDIINELEPPASIEVLEIKGYPGSSSPRWLVNNSLKNVVEMSLMDCMNWSSLTRMGYMPRLKLLKLYNLPSMREIGPEFYPQTPLEEKKFENKLEEILVEHMAELKAISLVQHFLLRRFVIRDCPLLQKIPQISHRKLTEVVLERVGLSNLTFQMSQPREEEETLSINIIDCPNISSIRGSANKSVTVLILQNCPELLSVAPSVFSSLLHLEIIDCDKLEIALHIKFMLSLQELHIIRCSKVTTENSKEAETGTSSVTPPSLRILHTDNISLIYELILTGVSIQVLTIEDCPQLKSLGELIKEFLHLKTFPETLKGLSLTNCENLKVLPRNMKVFSSLERLFLRDCANIRSLPVLPTSLEELQIIDCPILEKRCQEDGPDGSKITHIPYILIE